MFEGLSAEATTILDKKFALKGVQVVWGSPKQVEHGDASTSIALTIAKKLGRSPKEIAEELARELASVSSLEKAEVAGAGYVNVWLKPEALLAELRRSHEACIRKVPRKKDAPVIVEYSSPNIAKPLGVHHLLTTIIGQSIANIYEHQGFNVIKWNYIGDWGTQFGKLAVAFEKWGKKSIKECNLDDLLVLYVRFHTEVESDPTLEEKGRAAFAKLEKGDKELREFWTDVVSITKASLSGMYDRLHVSFDLDLGESFYEDKLEPVLNEGQKKGVFKVGEGGALIVEFPEEMNMPPYLVRKSDGATLYSTRDLAQMRYRVDTYHPQTILIVTDIAQKLHFEQLIESCKQLQWELPEFENVLTGRMRFADKKMSTRKGTIFKLEEVLDEAVSRAQSKIKEHEASIQTDDRDALAQMMGIGAIVYGILSQNRKMDLVFDWDKMLSFEGNSAPYLQYTHARARSVLRKAGEGEIEIPSVVVEFSSGERVLLRTLLLLPDVLAEALETRMPHKLANFLFQLCQDFNAFYNSDPILKAQGSARALRLYLTACTADSLRTGAELLTMNVPDFM